MARPGIGIWLIGAKGGVASTTIVGLAALKQGLVPPFGLVSSLPQFGHLGLADWNDFAVAGHEIRDVRLVDEAMKLATTSRAIDPRLIEQCQAELTEIDGRVRPGTIYHVGRTIEELAGAEIPRGESARDAIARVIAMKEASEGNNP